MWQLVSSLDRQLNREINLMLSNKIMQSNDWQLSRRLVVEYGKVCEILLNKVNYGKSLNL